MDEWFKSFKKGFELGMKNKEESYKLFLKQELAKLETEKVQATHPIKETYKVV